MSQIRILERSKSRNLKNTLRRACGWFRWQKEMRDCGWSIAMWLECKVERVRASWVMGVAEI